MSARRAAIDIGTVTTRLLVADVGGGRVSEVERRQVITRLGEGWTASGMLSDEAVSRVAGTVTRFAVEARELGAGEVRVAATSAARDAANAEDFLERLRSEAVVRPVIIEGSREAELSFAGATYDLEAEDVLVADLGGGSTELVLGTAPGGGEAPEVEAGRSIDVGSRRMTELYLRSDPPTSAEMASAGEWAVDEFRPFFDGLRTRPRSMVAVAGTATSLSAIKQHLEPYDPDRVHGSLLSGADLAGLREELASMPLARRREVVGLDPERADVIVAGALILETLVGMAGLDGTTVSEHDLLYGIVMEEAWPAG